MITDLTYTQHPTISDQEFDELGLDPSDYQPSTTEDELPW